MRRRLSVAMVVCLGICVAPLAITVAAQQKEGKAADKKETAKLERVEGNVHMIEKATKTVTVSLRGKTSTKDVVYSDSTKFTFRNKDASVDELKEGRHVICQGKTNDKNQLIATRIDVRDKM
jgi:cytochrome c-type biogenesis protein CcmE